MTKGEAVNWLINLMADIGKVEHQELWHYEQALEEIREIIEDEARKFDPCPNCQEFSCDECMWKDKRRERDG